MATLQLKGVPEELHARLRERAKGERMTMRDYVLGLLEEDLRRPSIREWSAGLARLEPLAPGLGGEEIVETIRRARAERAEHLLETVQGSGAAAGAKRGNRGR